jgi:hypothetical protein
MVKRPILLATRFTLKLYTPHTKDTKGTKIHFEILNNPFVHLLTADDAEDSDGPEPFF